MKSICIFCGSSAGNSEEYLKAAKQLGNILAKEKIKLVYGGAKVGLMGIVADTVLENNGEVIGVMPRSLVEKEVAHNSLTELKIVDTMHERKAIMHELSDAFIAMPGGLGTLDEIFESLTWGQLDIHKKPCAFYNISGYYDKLLDFIRHSIDEGFINQKHLEMILVASKPEELLEKRSHYKHPVIDKAKWIKGNCS